MSDNRQYSTTENLTLSLLGLMSLAVILLFIALGWYAAPSADDFCMAAGVQEDGLWWHLLNHYMTWSGRYSGNAFYAIYPLLSGGLLDGYKFLALLLLLSLFTAEAFFLARLLQRSMNDFPVIVVALLFTAVYVLGLRSPASSLYWMASSLSYLSANILLLVLGGLMIWLTDRQAGGGKTGLLLLITSVVVFLAVGANETGMLLVAGTVTLVMLAKLWGGWHIARPWLLLFVVAAVCSAVVYFSPGNAVRNTTFPDQHNLLFAIKGSLGMGAWTLLGWIFNPLFIATTLLTPVLTRLLHRHAGRSWQPRKRHLVTLIIATLLLPFLLEFPAWWAIGGWPPVRTVDAIYFPFLCSWLLTVAAMTLYFQAAKPVSSGQYLQWRGMTVFMLVTVLFASAIFINGRFQHALMDWQGAAPAYDAYLQQRYALLDNMIRQDKRRVIVPAFDGEYPRTTYFNDIVPKSTDWRNVCYAQYFGLKKVMRLPQTAKPLPKRARPPAPAMPTAGGR